MQFKKSTSVSDIISLCGPLIPYSLGSEKSQVNQFSTLEKAKPDSFVFINKGKLIDQARKSPAACVLAPLALKEEVKMDENKVWLFSPNVDRAAQMIKNKFIFSTPFRANFSGIHPTAVVDESAQISSGATVGPFAVIGENVEVGENAFVGSHCVIENKAIIGKDVTLHPHVYIGHSCEIGARSEVMPQAVIGSEGFGYVHDERGNHYRIPHTGKVILEEDVHVGAGTAIDRGTIENSVIGRGTKIDNQVHLAHNTIVGKNGLITAQVATAGSSQIGDNFICGGKTAITGHIKVADNVNVAGFSAISNNVNEGGQYGGYPLLPLKQSLKVKASSVHLPELRKQMNRVLRKLFPEDYKN